MKPFQVWEQGNADDYRNILVNRDEEKLGQISEGVEYKEFYFLGLGWLLCLIFKEINILLLIK